ncbi:MAG: hypothetical protein IPM49_15575 [Flavobacteriales bacterium]|nr:hypothetical protein [Flavobacteriales bacterium]
MVQNGGKALRIEEPVLQPLAQVGYIDAPIGRKPGKDLIGALFAFMHPKVGILFGVGDQRAIPADAGSDGARRW